MSNPFFGGAIFLAFADTTIRAASRLWAPSNFGRDLCYGNGQISLLALHILLVPRGSSQYSFDVDVPARVHLHQTVDTQLVCAFKRLQEEARHLVNRNKTCFYILLFHAGVNIHTQL